MAKAKNKATAKPTDIASLARRLNGRPFAAGPITDIDRLVERVLTEGANYTAGDPRDSGYRGGYPQVNVGQDHKNLLNFVRLAYRKSAPARVLVDRVAEEEWGEWFELSGGKENFRLAVEAFMKRPTGRVGERPLWWWFKRATRLARRDGRALLHFGLIEGGDADPESKPVNVKGVAYLQVITQDRIMDKRVGEDPDEPEQFGNILAWQVRLGDEPVKGEVPDSVWLDAGRVIPFIPDPSEDDLWEGDSLLATNVNYVEAVENMLFAALQAYSREAEPMVVVFRDGTGPTTPKQKAEVKREIRKVIEENTERVAFVQGVRVEVIEGTGALANPTPHWDIAIQAYSMATGIPRPILTGEQVGELVAATEAAKRWANVISRIQETDGDPIVNILLTYLEAWGVEAWAQLPSKDAVEIKWNSLREEDPGTEATRQKTLAETWAIYVDREGTPPAAIDFDPTTDPEMLRIAEAAKKPAAPAFGAASPFLESESLKGAPSAIERSINRFRARVHASLKPAYLAASINFRDNPSGGDATPDGARLIIDSPAVRDALAKAIEDAMTDSLIAGGTLAAGRIGPDAYYQNLQGTESFKSLSRGLAEDVAKRLSDDVRRIVAAQLAAGSSPRGISDAIMERYAATKVDAERIARTESIRAFNRGGLEAMTENGVNSYKWSAFADADDSDPTGVCAVLNEQVFQVGRGPVPVDDTHPNCVLPGQAVEGTFSAGLQARYSGPAREFITASGKRLAVTPNHPVLTTKGFAAAAAIQKGDHLVSHNAPIHGLADADHEQAPVVIEAAHHALAERGLRQRVPIAAEDLHGDAVHGEGEVDVVSVAGQLRDRNLVAPAQLDAERNLQAADAKTTLLAGGGASLLHGGAVSLSASSLVGGGDLALPGSVSHAAPSQALRLGLAPQFNASALEGVAERLADDAASVAEFLEAHAGLVLLDEVVEVRDYHFTGHVYDLQAEGSAYWCNGIAVHNCKCALIPVVTA